MRFEKILLIADIDGTLVTDDKQIPKRNKTAIREFTENGGIFTIATGRGVTLARPIAEELMIGAPAVVFNGGAVYDYAQNRFLWQSALPSVASDYARLVSEQLPHLGIEILRGEDVYVPQSNETEEYHLAGGVKNPIRCPISEIPENNWIKILFADEPQKIDAATEIINRSCSCGVELVRTSPLYYEMLPLGTSKGGGMRKMLDIAGLSECYVVAAGDYINDLEMLEYADFGIAVSNALDDIKAIADLTVSDNNSGAIWDIVEYLKKHPNRLAKSALL